MDKIQIGHIEMMWSIGMSMCKVGNHLLDIREVAQGFPHMLRIIIALPVDQILQPVSFLLGVNDIIYFVFLILILYDM